MSGRLRGPPMSIAASAVRFMSRIDPSQTITTSEGLGGSANIEPRASLKQNIQAMKDNFLRPFGGAAVDMYRGGPDFIRGKAFASGVAQLLATITAPVWLLFGVKDAIEVGAWSLLGASVGWEKVPVDPANRKNA